MVRRVGTLGAPEKTGEHSLNNNNNNHNHNNNNNHNNNKKDSLGLQNRRDPEPSHSFSAAPTARTCGGHGHSP
jgi:hypothetical protein